MSINHCGHARCNCPAREEEGDVSDEREWFCPQCGPMPTVDEDGCCAECGATCCRMSELRELLATRGLAIVPAADVLTAEERAVLEACATAEVAQLSNGWRMLDGDSNRAVTAAELARRAQKSVKENAEAAQAQIACLAPGATGADFTRAIRETEEAIAADTVTLAALKRGAGSLGHPGGE